MTETIGEQSWMSAPATRAVIAALEAKGGEGCVRFVGGCVRNALMGIAVDDVDLATTLDPDAVTEALKAARLRPVPTGVEHGTVTAISESTPYEITTLRRDVTTDGRNATVAFTDDWREDALRRDFRFNALYADPDGTLFDPTGEGVTDARAGRVVFVGDPEVRIREDHLRILRFFRFHAWYGRTDPDPAGLAACEAFRSLIGRLSAERISKELLKLLAAPDPRKTVQLMASTGVLAEVLPSLADLGQFERLVEIEVEQFGEADAELRLAALLPNAQAALEAASRLRLSNAQRDRLEAALAPGEALTSWMSPKAARRLVYRLGGQAFADRVKLASAASDRSAAASQWRALLALGQTWSAPRLPVTGEDAVAAGVPVGPLVGKVLREVEAWWIDHDFPDDRMAAIEQLKAAAQGMAY